MERRVVEAARRAIAEHGWQAVTQERLADAAGISRMTLHRHGIGRAEILGLLAADYAEDFAATLEAAAAGEGDVCARLRAALSAVCDVSERHLDFLAALDEEMDSRLFHEDDADVRSRRAYVDCVERLLVEGVEAGVLVGLDPVEGATVLVNAVDRTYRHLRHSHRWDAERSRRLMLDIVIAGVTAPG